MILSIGHTYKPQQQRINTEDLMALYMLQAKYTSEAIRNIAESGSNREEAARAVIEQCGGKRIGMWGMLGTVS